MIRGLFRAGMVAAGIGYAVERLLAETAKDSAADPVRMLVVIDAPIQRVWDELTDIEGQPRWMHDMKSVAIDSDGPVGVGTTAHATVRMFGIAVGDPVTITEFEPPTRFALSHDGLFKGSGVFDLEAGADGTTTIVRWEETLVAPVLPNLGAAIGAPIFSSVFQADLERLRDLVEGETTDPLPA